MNKRQYLTPTEKLAILVKQDWRCSCGCGRPIWPVHRIEWEHTLPIGLGGPSKPDAAMLYLCHKIKTKGDKRRIAKAKRMRNKFLGIVTRKKKPIPSRPFSTCLRKKMNGEVVAR
ncbi:hypothetical protein [Denitrobaculum tricleocarpae]|uniref:HNH endonuclease n=1 Tax=Denitrobaculum tricleocarpae TaxID=2591009 RepID=A0A545TSY3_9PROT|nr:hypothetical protein [Denitrobaculum tricleocarpae]TQV80334.1 hypothetical protein FKG95_09065 [Denitrobaculum tricleocarpae]